MNYMLRVTIFQAQLQIAAESPLLKSLLQQPRTGMLQELHTVRNAILVLNQM